jgi:hypothetical protein
MLLSDSVRRTGLHHRRKRVSAIAFARSLHQKSDGELEQIALDNADDERTLWVMLDILQQRRGNSNALIKQIRGRLLHGKPLPLRKAAIWTTVAPRPSGRPGYLTLGRVVVIAVAIAVAHITEADAHLWEMIFSGVQSLGSYLAN